MAPFLVKATSVAGSSNTETLNTQRSGTTAQLINWARVRRITLMGRGEHLPPASLDRALESAANVLQKYCDDLLEELAASLPPTLDPEAARAVRICYTDLVLEFARSVRDEEIDAGRRHALAQPIQQKVLEAERRVVQFLDTLIESANQPSTPDDSPCPGVSSPNRS